jgi:hypothetical protein
VETPPASPRTGTVERLPSALVIRRAFLSLARHALRELTAGSVGFVPPLTRADRVFGAALDVGFRFSVLLSVLLLYGVATTGSSSDWLAWAKLAAGAMLLAEGALLAANRRRARQLLLWRLTRKSAAPRSLRARLLWRAAPSGLALLGLIWFAAGLATAAVAAAALL